MGVFAPGHARHLVLHLCFFVVLSAGPASGRSLAEEIADVLPIVEEAYTFLHENPELGKAEFKAQTFLKARLGDFGFTQFVESKAAPTAVIAVLDTGRPGPVVALRSEMDARPLEKGVSEPLNHKPRSRVPERMHNCGHDVHAAILLGTAALLFRNPGKLAGKIVFLFQPAEEIAGGADDIVGEGLLKALGVQKIFAQHVAPGMPVGTLSLSPGTPLAGSSYFKLRLKGRGSHAATPFEGDDLPVLASKVVQELSNLPARHIDIANRPVVVSVTKIEAVGPASNMLPTQAEISGTVRAFENPLTSRDASTPIAELLRLTVEKFAVAAGVTYEWEFRLGAPPTTNNQWLFDEVVGALRRTWPGTLDARSTRGMFSEDFAYYTQAHPALYFGLGIARDGQGDTGVHTTEFTTSPAALPYGVRLLVSLARIGTVGTASWD